jgi:hypothetical protein
LGLKVSDIRRGRRHMKTLKIGEMKRNVRSFGSREWDG